MLVRAVRQCTRTRFPILRACHYLSDFTIYVVSRWSRDILDDVKLSTGISMLEEQVYELELVYLNRFDAAIQVRHCVDEIIQMRQK